MDQFRTIKLVSLWQAFLSNLRVRQSDNLLVQYISENILTDLLKASMTSLSAIEDNAMCYACEYGAMFLLCMRRHMNIPSILNDATCTHNESLIEEVCSN